ncbi:hypothetical protein AA313_de0204809 [Arthrobotrys entomopaga]|nr:hypothetical protein AA313_de0204809 [Arthrobotrys entomopaga]
MGGIEGWRKIAPNLGMITTPWDLEHPEVPKTISVLRNKYSLESKPVTARIYATAFGLYSIFINGKRVGDSIMEPGWTEYSRRVSYQSYNVTEYLQRGENNVTVYVADGWYRGLVGPTVKSLRGKRGNFGNETGFMAIMDLFDREGKQNTFWTGSTKETGWKCNGNGPILDSQIYNGEHYDARNNVDAIKREDWKDVKVMASAFTNPNQILEASVAPPIRHTESFSVIATSKTPDGKTILDFGQNIAGRLRIKGRAPSGTKITLLHVEILTPDGRPNTEILRDAKATDSYIFNGCGIETWEPEFTYHGFRYAQVDPWIEGLEVEARVYGSDLSKGLMKFKSTNPELDRLVANIEWSAKGNYFGVPTDCPQRDERLGW